MLVFRPWPLAFDYYDWPQAHSPLDVWPQALLVSALFALTVLAVIRKWPAGFAGAVFFLVLAPTSSLLPIPTEVAAEHRMYLPLAAVIALTLLSAFGLMRSRAARLRTGQAFLLVAFVMSHRGRDPDTPAEHRLLQRRGVGATPCASARGTRGRASTTASSSWPRTSTPRPRR